MCVGGVTSSSSPTDSNSPNSLENRMASDNDQGSQLILPVLPIQHRKFVQRMKTLSSLDCPITSNATHSKSYPGCIPCGKIAQKITVFTNISIRWGWRQVRRFSHASQDWRRRQSSKFVTESHTRGGYEFEQMQQATERGQGRGRMRFENERRRSCQQRRDQQPTIK